MEKANRVAQRVRRAAALTAELAAQSEKKVAVVCNHPPGLRDEPAEHITAPNMGVGGSHPQAEMIASLTDETLNFFVKATGKDEASMRQQLTSQMREELRRSRDHWKARRR